MNIMKFFGFENDEDDYDDDDYQEERRTPRKGSGRREGGSRSSSSSQGNSGAIGRLVLYKGVASENDKRRLREAFNDGAFILIDLNDLDAREFEERGRDFVTFMGGLAFARGGEIIFIKPAQYLVTPRADMFETWPEDSEQE